MLTEVEYKEVKEVGQALGYLLENNLDNLENNYELKNTIIQACVSYSMSKDKFRLKGDLNQINIPNELKEKLMQLIINIKDLSTTEKKGIFTTNILIPDDDEFIDHQSLLQNINQLAELYHVPVTTIASKIIEINKYVARSQNIGQKQ